MNLDLLLMFAYNVPALIVYLVGLILSITRKRYHPQSASYAMFGFLVLLLETLFFACVRTLLIADRGGSGLSAMSYGRLYSIISFFQLIFFLAGIGLLMAAIFVGRKTTPQRNWRDEPDLLDAPRQDRTPPSPPPADQPETYRDKRTS